MTSSQLSNLSGVAPKKSSRATLTHQKCVRSFVRSFVRLFVHSLILSFFSQDVPIPWKAIFTSLPLWAIVLAHFTQTWGLYTMMSELPLYFNQRLHLNLKQVTMTTNVYTRSATHFKLQFLAIFRLLLRPLYHTLSNYWW